MIPDFNDAVHRRSWREALDILHSTNNFPEFTGRLCPAPCESACVLGLISPPVSIELIEKYIVERGFSEGWIKAKVPMGRTGKKIAVVGSGPAGLAAAQQLNYAGHSVQVYERDKKVGGLLRYGIPDFKLEKSIIDRRIDLMIEEGIKFITSTEVGKDIDIEELYVKNDVVLLCGGATIKRGLPIPGSDSKGIIQAMDFLKNQNQIIDEKIDMHSSLNAKNKNVIVIGGGDTGSDCIGTSNRQGAKSVVNFEILPKPPKQRSNENPWPYWPFTLKSSSSHEEGSKRKWSILTKEFISDKSGKLTGLKTIEVEWKKIDGQKSRLIEIDGTEKIWPCDMVLLALGFTGPEKNIYSGLKLKTDEFNKPLTKNYMTSNKKVFAAGDLRRGQSLIVWAISEGREAAYRIDEYLMGYSNLPSKIKGDLPLVK
jgi:glutamate synthase (NADPH/NADH) small chain